MSEERPQYLTRPATLITDPPAAVDHLRWIYADYTQVPISKGEMEQLRSLKREVLALRDAVQFPRGSGEEVPLENVLVTGNVLKALFDLL